MKDRTVTRFHELSMTPRAVHSSLLANDSAELIGSFNGKCGALPVLVGSSLIECLPALERSSG